MVYCGERPVFGSGQVSMVGPEALRVLGSPEVRNAILLNEIGVLIHELGKLSAEFLSAGSAFPHHLILRRATRGMDPCLGSEIRPLSAVLYALRYCSLTDQERAVASLLEEKIDTLTGDDRAPVDAVSRKLEAALGDLRCAGTPDRLEAVERVGCLARGVLADWAWQIQGERGLEAMEPPFISAEGFHEGLDQLPFVADLVEMQGRTWHPEGLLPPEVRLFRAIHEREEGRGTPRARCHVEQVDRAAVRWLGVRAIARWAFGKVLVGTSRRESQTSLWEHCWTLSGLYKSSTAQVLIDGLWPQWHRLSWRTLRVGLERPDPVTLDLVKGVIEVEYPLGNELRRSDTEIHFTFPGFESELATSLLDGLRAEVGRLAGGNVRLRMALGLYGAGATR